MNFSSFIDTGDWLIFPLEGEMGGSPEGDAAAARDVGSVPSPAATTPPDRSFDKLRTGHPPLMGEGAVAPAVSILAEAAADVAAREALLDRAMGPGRRKKSSEKLRRGRKPSEGLAFVARDAGGNIVGTVRLWDVALGLSPLEGEMSPQATEGVASKGTANMSSTAVTTPPPACGRTLPSRGREALLLGPLAVDPSLKGAGIGSALVAHAIAEARRLGHKAILLVGDAPYYGRFGFSAEKTEALAMPGPYERHRFLALELVPGTLDDARGVLQSAGRKAKTAERAVRAA